MNELVVRAPEVSFGDMERLADAIAKSKLFGLQSKEQALTLMAIAQAEGRHPALAARDYDIIQNKPAKKAEAMQRDFLAAGGKIQWHRLDDTGADATFSHPAGGTVRIEWDLDRAKTAGLLDKDMWKKYRRAMFRSRVISEGVRSVFPTATSGMYVPEEVRSGDTPEEGVIEGTATDLGSAAGSSASHPPSTPKDATVKSAEISRGPQKRQSIRDWMEELEVRLMTLNTENEVINVQREEQTVKVYDTLAAKGNAEAQQALDDMFRRHRERTRQKTQPDLELTDEEHETVVE